MKRSAFIQWRGNLKEGIGFINSESGSLSNVPYSYSKRFEDEPGTNPEELIAAAFSACFAMAMSAELDKKKLRAENIDVSVTISLEQNAKEWKIPHIHLLVTAYVPKASFQEVQQAAEAARSNCPVSKLLHADITMQFIMGNYETSAVH